MYYCQTFQGETHFAFTKKFRNLQNPEILKMKEVLSDACSLKIIKERFL